MTCIIFAFWSSEIFFVARYIVFVNVPCAFAQKLLTAKFSLYIFSSSLMVMLFKSAILLIMSCLSVDF